MKHRIIIVLAAGLLLAGCNRQPSATAGTIPRDRFVAANVAVRALPDSATPAQRRVALRKAGVTERQLRTWVTMHAREPETLAKAWEEIAFKVDSLSGGAPLPGAMPPNPTVTDMPQPVRNRDSVMRALERRRDSLGLPSVPPVQVRPGQPPRPGRAEPPTRPGRRRPPRVIEQ